MTTFKTTQEILNGSKGISLAIPPFTYDWLYINQMSINDVDIWEEIYYQEGGIGIYAAWRPKAEFYIITHELFLEMSVGIETFYGANSGQQVWDRATELEIKLPINQNWINTKDEWLHINEHLTPP
jgi:hypothetical protein